MSTYIGMLRMRLISGMQYRAAAWAGVATQLFWGFMQLMIYHAFYQNTSVDPGMDFTQLTAYIWLRQAFLALIMLWFTDDDLLKTITSGDVAYELCRPVNLYWLWYARLLGTRWANVALRCLPILLIAMLLPEPYRLMLPQNLPALTLFLVSLCLSGLLVVALSMFVYLLTFVTLSPLGVRLFIAITFDFLAGNTLPIPLMPASVQVVLAYLPFQYVFDLPVRIYSGHIDGMQALQGVGLQVFWIVFTIALGALCMKYVLRRTIVQGG